MFKTGSNKAETQTSTTIVTSLHHQPFCESTLFTLLVLKTIHAHTVTYEYCCYLSFPSLRFSYLFLYLPQTSLYVCISPSIAFPSPSYFISIDLLLWVNWRAADSCNLYYMKFLHLTVEPWEHRILPLPNICGARNMGLSWSGNPGFRALTSRA